MTRILVADDHEVVRAGLRLVLEAQPGWEVVAEAPDGKDAVRKAIDIRPDVAIVDYLLPVLNGVEVTRQIKTRLPEVEVLIFTMHDSRALVADLLDAGARAYVLKSDPNEDLISAVKSLAVHKPFLGGRLSEALLEGFLSKNTQASPSDLSPRERAIVQLIAEGHTNKELAALLGVSTKTVEAHRASAMHKLGLTSAASLTRYAIKTGLVDS